MDKILNDGCLFACGNIRYQRKKEGGRKVYHSFASLHWVQAGRNDSMYFLDKRPKEAKVEDVAILYSLLVGVLCCSFEPLL